MKLPTKVKIRKVLRVPKLGVCHEWTGALYKKTGYGKRAYKGKTWLAHRAAWDEEVGEIADGMLILHHCDNPLCVRISHLYEGTHSDNNRDVVIRNRANNRGEHNGRCILSDSQVQEIRDRYSRVKITQNQLATEYGVGQSQISRLLLGEQRKLESL